MFAAGARSHFPNKGMRSDLSPMKLSLRVIMTGKVGAKLYCSS